MSHLLGKAGSFFLGRRYSIASSAPEQEEKPAVADSVLLRAPAGPDEAAVPPAQADASTSTDSAAAHTTSRVVVIYDDPRWEGSASRPFSWRRLIQFCGPAFLMSIAYIDPGNLESDLQAGSRTGYTLGWVLLWSTAMGYMFQLQAARLGVATGRGLAQHCRSEYPPAVRRLLWVMVELAIIGGDIQEVVGSAIALLLLSGGAIPLHVGVVLTVVVSFALTFIERLGVRHLEALFGLMISVMGLSFGGMFFTAGVPYKEVLTGVLVPRLPASQAATAVGIVGAVIMPHNIFLHSALVNSRRLDTGSIAAKREAVRYFAIESAAALAATLFINVAVMAVFAVGFFGRQGVEIGLENAGQFLSERFGPAMGVVWAVGLLAAGQASTMTGTYTGQFVMSGFLNIQVPNWQRVLITRGVALWPTLGVALTCKDSSDLDVMNQALNILQSIILPFAIIPVLKLTSSARIMGPEMVPPTAQRYACWVIAMAVIVVNMFLAHDQISTVLSHWSAPAVALCYLAVSVYAGLVAYLAVGPKRMSRLLQRRPSGPSGSASTAGPGDQSGLSQPLLPASAAENAGRT